MGKHQKRPKNGPKEALAGGEIAPAVVVNEIHGFAYEVPRNDLPAVVRFYCKAATCPGYPHKPSDLAHPASTCGSLLNATEDNRPLETISLSEFDELPALEPEHRTQPENDLPEVLPSEPPGKLQPMGLVALEQLEQLEPMALEQNALTSHDMPPLPDAVTAADVWDLPDPTPETDSPGALEPFPVPVRESFVWQPPEAPTVPPPPMAGTWLRRAEGLSSFPDYIRVVGSGAISAVIVFVWPNHWMARTYTPWEFQGLELIEQGETLPDWVQETHQKLNIPALLSGDTSKTVAADGSVKRDDVFQVEAPAAALEQPEEEDLPPVLAPPPAADPLHEEPAGVEDFWPDIGSFWFDGKLLYEIIEHKLDKRMMLAAEYGPTPEQRGDWSYTDRGLACTVVITLEEFGALLPFEHCPPPWVLDYRASRIAQVAIALHEKTTMALLEVAKDEIAQSVQNAEKHGQAEEKCLAPHPLTAISSCMHELADELHVKPSHVMTTVEAVLQTLGSLVTFRDVWTSSPAVEALLLQLSQGIAAQKGLQRVIALAFHNIVGKAVDERVQQLTQPFLAAMAGGASVGKAAQTPKKTAKDEGFAEAVEEVRGLVEADCRRMISEAFEAWSAKHRSPVNPDDWAELGKDLGKAESRIFKVEGQIKDILAEVGHINKSFKLQKEDSLTSSDRGKAYRQRQREKADEKAHNLAKLRIQKAADDAVMNEGKPKKSEKTTVTTPTGKMIDRFMGRAADPKVRALLGRIPPTKLPRFFEQAAKGLPDTQVTPWKTREIGEFAKWYYATLNKR